MTTPGEIYSKLTDRRLELIDEMTTNLSTKSFYIEQGFAEAVRIVYDLIMDHEDDDWLKEGEENA